MLYTISEVMLMILSNLSSILGKKRLKMSKVITDTKISRPTLTALYYNAGKGINFDTLNTLCKHLHISPGDLFSFYDIDIDNISVTYSDMISNKDIFINEYECLNVISDLPFSGHIDFIQKNLSPLSFHGSLNNPTSNGEYDLDITWDCSNDFFNTLIPDNVEDEIYNSVYEALLESIPYDTGFESPDIGDTAVSYNPTDKQQVATLKNNTKGNNQKIDTPNKH